MNKRIRKKKQINEEANDMSVATINNRSYNSLDLNKLKSKKHTIISSKEALKDITPIEWSEDVLSGKKKVIIDCNK